MQNVDCCKHLVVNIAKELKKTTTRIRFGKDFDSFLKENMYTLRMLACCTVSLGKKSATYIWHSVVVYLTKPLHCSCTVWWFSGALKFSRRYFLDEDNLSSWTKRNSGENSWMHQTYKPVPNSEVKEICSNIS